MTKEKRSATTMSGKDGLQYHIHAKPGDMAELILVVGAQERAYLVAEQFSEIQFKSEHRGFVVITGLYQNVRMTVFATGIGGSCTEIAIIEAMQITKQPTFLRIGTSGGLQEFINPGDFVITTGSIPLEDISTRYVYPGYPAVAHHKMVSTLVSECEKIKQTYHCGLTASSDSFYAGQGRVVLDLPIQNASILDDMERMKVLNFEMESSIIFTLAALKNCVAGCMCIALNNRQKDSVISPELAKQQELVAIKVGLNTLLKFA